MARIVRHNDESVREGYIRNGGKDVKLFTSTLKAFQCNNRIVMAQRKHLDDFLRGRIIGRLECERTQQEVSEELGIAQSVISRPWQRFQDDATGTTVSRQTVYRRLGHIGLYARRPVRCVPLTATHCRLRLTWSREHALWTPQQWCCVMFSTSPGLVCSLILAGLYYGERQVPVTTKRTPFNDTATVFQEGSFGEELFLAPELTSMFRV
ncbi:HTH_Tnp_Tc3_2 domain-containing protein [Trichonephila clavipes]|nr:HTH_Tnp_Tc3_2 domain-containing protein [Trichonephila clavipes]